MNKRDLIIGGLVATLLLATGCSTTSNLPVPFSDSKLDVVVNECTSDYSCSKNQKTYAISSGLELNSW